MEIIIKENYEMLSKAAADLVADVIKNNPKAVLGLATGSSPIGIYKELINKYNQNEISFKDIKTVNLDEYIGLDGSHEQSYRYFMNDILFNHIDIDKKNTYVPNGKASDIDFEAKEYEKTLDNLGGQDIQILGVGENGHIGFNEPDSKLNLYTHMEDLQSSTIEANSRFFESIEDVPTQAISMGIGSILKAKKIVLIANGENKAKAIKSLTDDFVTPLIPVSFLKLHPDVTVIIDKDAAKLIENQI